MVIGKTIGATERLRLALVLAVLLLLPAAEPSRAASLEAVEGFGPNPGQLDQALLAIPGVVGTGLFVEMADVVVIQDGDRVEVRERG